MAEQKNTKDTAVKPQSVTVNATLTGEDYARVRRARHVAEFEKRSDFIRTAVNHYAEKVLAEHGE